jgi:hypothetical protein
VSNILALDIADASNNWQNYIDDCKLIKINQQGIDKQRTVNSRNGRAIITFDNTSGNYSPDSVTRLDTDRLLRVRYILPTHGYCMRLAHNGRGGKGNTMTVSGNAASVTLGTNSTGLQFHTAQTIYVDTAGLFTSFKVRHGTTNGAVSGTVTWELRSLDLETKRPTTTVLETGTYTPTASAQNTITPAGTTYLSVGYYAIILKPTSAQATNVYWQVRVSTSHAYSYGYFYQVKDSVTNSWVINESADQDLELTTSVVNNYIELDGGAQASAVSDVWVLSWEARATLYGYDTDQVFMLTNAETQAATDFEYTHKWASYSLTFTAAAIGTSIKARFRPIYETDSGGTAQGVEYRNFTLKKNGGSNVLTNGTFTNGTTGWSATNTTSATNTIDAIRDYDYLFFGYIETIDPAPFATAGKKTTMVEAGDFQAVLETTALDLPLQESKTSDELVNTALVASIPDGIIAGVQIDTGTQVFPSVLDKYTKSNSSLVDLLTDAAISELCARFWIDGAGTLRLTNKFFIPEKITDDPVLTLGNSDRFDMTVNRSTENQASKVIITYTPRTVQDTGVLLTTTSASRIPPKTATGPGKLVLTLAFQDTAGNPIGAQSVITPLVRGTDVRFNLEVDENGEANPANGEYTTTTFPVTGQYVVEMLYKVSASEIEITFLNHATGAVYLVKGLQVRGVPVVSRDPVTVIATDTTQRRERKHTVELPFSADGDLARIYADYLLNRYKDPFTEITDVMFNYTDEINGVNLLTVELMDIIEGTDTQTGLTAVKHMIIGRDMTLAPQAGERIVQDLHWTVERLDQTAYGRLDDATYGLLDSTAILYI